MRFYQYAGNIKAGLFILGIILVIGLLAYTQRLVNELRNDNREIVRLYAGIIANIVKDDSDVNLDLVFENIIQKVKFPIGTESHIPLFDSLKSKLNPPKIKVL